MARNNGSNASVQLTIIYPEIMGSAARERTVAHENDGNIEGRLPMISFTDTMAGASKTVRMLRAENPYGGSTAGHSVFNKTRN